MQVVLLIFDSYAAVIAHHITPTNKMDTRMLRACETGNLEAAKELLRSSPSIDLHANMDQAFRIACNWGHMDLAQWIWDLAPVTDEEVLRGCFVASVTDKNGLDFAKWLKGVATDLSFEPQMLQEALDCAQKCECTDNVAWLIRECGAKTSVDHVL